MELKLITCIRALNDLVVLIVPFMELKHPRVRRIGCDGQS